MRGLFANQRAVALLLVVIVAASLGWPLLVRSLFRGDTDLWYHLAAGRFLVETGGMEATSYFSFLEPPRTWVDYFWLFQWIAFRVHALAGAWGLIVLRAMLGVATLLTAAGVLRASDKRGDWRSLAMLGFVLWMLSEVLLYRDSNLRPHAFSYLFLALFIFVLEVHPRRAWVLPLIAVAWTNVHGISYPVLYVVCFAYLGEAALTRWRERGTDGPRTPLGSVPWLLISLMAVWATPHGAALIPVPFMLTPRAAEYIKELKQLDWVVWDSSFDRGSPMSNLVTPVLFALNARMAVLSVVRWKARFSHLAMLFGGLYLMSKANRFLAELALLGLPYTHALLDELRTRWAPSTRGRARVLAVVVVLLALGALQTWKARPRLPFASAPLPLGASAFLNQHGGGGKVLHRPDYGGYLRWALPGFKIFMDMEVPFFFTDDDIFLSSIIHGTQGDLSPFLARYQPEFILAELNHAPLLTKVAGQERYRPIFFDDNFVIFADRNQRPELVARFELRALDPRGHALDSFKQLSFGKDRAQLLAELERVHALWPEGGLVNRWLGEARLEEGNPEAALGHAQQVIREYPLLSVGWLTAGDSLRALGRHDESVELLEQGLDRVPADRWGRLDRSLALSFLAKGDAGRAYATFKKAGTVYANDVTAEDLWSFSQAAALSGHDAEALELLRYAHVACTPKETALRARIEDLLKKLEAR